MLKQTVEKIILIFVLFAFCQVSTYGFEYEKSNKVSVFVNPKVTYSAGHKRFLYEYNVVNSAKSIQSIWAFSIIFDESYRNVKAPAGWATFRPNNPKLPKMIDWAAVECGDYIPVHSNIDPSPYQISPGKSLSGFSFESPGLPGIVNFYAEGFTRLPKFPKGLAENPPKEYDRLDDVFKNYTVGPVFMADLSPGSLLSRLGSLTMEIQNYNWAKTKLVSDNLVYKLECAQKELFKGDNKSTCNQLYAYINILDQQKDQFTDNSYSLLKVNAEYIIICLDQ